MWGVLFLYCEGRRLSARQVDKPDLKTELVRTVAVTVSGSVLALVSVRYKAAGTLPR